MAFCPKILGGGGDLQIIILLKMNAASVVVTCEVVRTLNHYKMVNLGLPLTNTCTHPAALKTSGNTTRQLKLFQGKNVKTHRGNKANYLQLRQNKTF